MLTDEGNPVGAQPGKGKAPLVGSTVAIFIFCQPARGIQKLLPRFRRFGITLRVHNPCLAEQLQVVVQPLRMAIQRQSHLLAFILSRSPDVWQEVGRVKISIRLDKVIERAKHAVTGELGDTVGVADKHIGRAAVSKAQHQLVVIGAPGDNLHFDTDARLPLEPFDNLLHRGAVGTGEPVPETDFGPGDVARVFARRTAYQ